MKLASGRIIPNWILQLSFRLFDDNTTMTEVIEDIEDIMRDELNVTDRSGLSLEDALEVYKKFNEIQIDYDNVLEDFFEKHGLGHDEYDGDDDDDDGDDGDDDDDNKPDDPGDDVPHEESKAHGLLVGGQGD